MIAQNTGANVQKLLQLREAGVQVFMDDFGTGYSGLSQIAHLPLDALKIDRSFVAGMTISAEHMAIVSAIINLAHALRIYVVAEGVETEEQAARAVRAGLRRGAGLSVQPPAAGRGHRQTPLPAPLTEPRLAASLSSRFARISDAPQ